MASTLPHELPAEAIITLARTRYELGLGLTYEDVSVLTGYAVKTLQNWMREGKLAPIKAGVSSKSVRFSKEEVQRIVGVGKTDPDGEDNEDTTKHQRERRREMGAALSIYRPPHGEKEAIQTSNSGDAGGRQGRTEDGESQSAPARRRPQKSPGTSARERLSRHISTSEGKSR